MALVLEIRPLRPPILVIHGGAGAYLSTSTPERLADRGRALLAALREGYAGFRSGGGRAAVLAAIGRMEEDPHFNAGRGSKLQQDGRCRLSAAIMDGRRTRLAGIYNVQDCLHPSHLADELLERGDRNLDGEGARQLMSELGMALADLKTPRTFRRWRDLVARGDKADAEAAVGDANQRELVRARAGDLPMPEDLPKLKPPEPSEGNQGTVGAVALDAGGELWACTSTGGRGHEFVGRVSDTPMPSGNYACPAVALSATGFGEQIIDLNLCGRVATRMLDGASLERALRRTFDEVTEIGALLGLIAVAANGDTGYAHTTEACGVAWMDAEGSTHLDRHSAS